MTAVQAFGCYDRKKKKYMIEYYDSNQQKLENETTYFESKRDMVKSIKVIKSTRPELYIIDITI